MRKIFFTTLVLSSMLPMSACFFPEVPLENRSCTSDSDCLSGYFCGEADICISLGDAGVPADVEVGDVAEEDPAG